MTEPHRGPWGHDDIPNQSGRVAVVTGANSGIGWQTAKALATKGAHVVLACRNPDKGRDAVERILSEHAEASLELTLMDLSDLDSVAECAAKVLVEHPRLDLLINNAGVMVPPPGKTKQGFDLQLGTNHFGHFALTGRLLPALLGTEGARVVTVSSGMHKIGTMDFDDLHFEKRSYGGWAAYGQSKLANLLFTFELQRKLVAAEAPTMAVAAHPGYTSTDLQRTWALGAVFNPLIAMSPPKGCLPTLRAATALDVVGGEYYGAKGIFEFNGPPVRVKASAKAQNEEDAARLWTISEESTGVTYDLGGA